MRRTKQPAATGSSNFWAAGSRDPLLKKMLGNRMLQHLANGKKPAPPKSNFENARAYYLKQQAAKRSK